MSNPFKWLFKKGRRKRGATSMKGKHQNEKRILSRLKLRVVPWTEEWEKVKLCLWYRRENACVPRSLHTARILNREHWETVPRGWGGGGQAQIRRWIITLTTSGGQPRARNKNENIRKEKGNLKRFAEIEYLRHDAVMTTHCHLWKVFVRGP